MAKVLLLCQDKIGRFMAGPAIRYWEMAQALSKQHEVSLIAFEKSDISSDNFRILNMQEDSLSHAIQSSNVLVTQRIAPEIAWNAKKSNTKIILDAYDPQLLEQLEIFRKRSLAERETRHAGICQEVAFDFQMADGILCANRRQKDLWVGFLLALNKITPTSYDESPALEKQVAEVPFGLTATPPKASGPGLRSRFNIPENAKVLLWGGGIWNWFDPLTLLRAMKRVVERRSDVHLVFMGIKHPNPSIPEMEMCGTAIALAKELDLLNHFVHINFGWIPYEERQNFLLEADIGVSMHFDHLETQYSFRTRILDYLWGRLPIIATEGDLFAELIKTRTLGIVVPFHDDAKLADAICALCDDPALVQQMRTNIEAITPYFEWQRVVEPLNKMIVDLTSNIAPADSRQKIQVIVRAFRCYGLKRVLFSLLKRVKMRLKKLRQVK